MARFFSKVVVVALLLREAAVVALQPPKIWLDFAAGGTSLGRVEVALTAYECLPRLVENLRLIASGERKPRCSLDGVPLAVARESPQYKFSHTFAPAFPAIDVSLLKSDASSKHRVAAFGGHYYAAGPVDDDAVALTTPLSGPGAFKRFSLVRVGASPVTWKQRLLVNAAVLGVASNAEADAVLHRLATTDGAPVIERAGVVPPEDDCLVPSPEDVEGDDCIWDAGQERDWRERRFLRVEKEGNRDPSRGNSGTVR